VLQQVEADFDPIPFDASAARAFGRVAAQLRASGCKTSARAYDALIAATAVANGLPVYTRNPDDFAGIEALTVVTVGDAS
jgi:predicted nucleic acid-binding protein